jgi:tetratricopeptide (TPR) repeat protein
MAQPRRSLDSVAAALPLVRESADRLAEADAHETAARVRSRTGDHPRARADFARALDLYRAVGSLRGESNVHQGLGTLALNEGDPVSAMRELERARDLRRRIGVRSLEVETLSRLVQAARRAGHLARARALAEETVAIVNGIGASVFARELRLSYGETVQRISEDHVGVLLDLHREAPGAGYDRLAFEAADRAKARGLVERLRESGITGAELSPELPARERALRDEMA